MPYDESSLLTKITQHLNAAQASGASHSSLALKGGSGVSSGSQNNAAMFLNLNEQLKSSVSMNIYTYKGIVSKH